MDTSEAASDTPKAGDGKIVLRNTMYLGLAEILVVPISIVLNGLLGRYLGPEDMGYLFLAMTITKFAFLIVEWGHGYALPAAVVLDRPNAGKLLGNSIAWRLSTSFVAYLGVAVVCHFLGYSEKEQWVIGLTFLLSLVQTCLSACQEVIRGFERTDVAAYSRVGSQFLMVALVVPTLVLGGRLRAAVLAQIVATLIVLFAVQRTLRPSGVGKVGVHNETFKKLMTSGTPFVFFSFGLVFQPFIDAFFLKTYSSAEVVGWFSVAQKLTGFLVLPATALIGALYPTLTRLFATDKEGYDRTTRGAVSGVSLLVVPASLGCALFPDLGVSIFGRDQFSPSEDTLRMFSVFLVLIYFTLPIGCAMVAAGRQRLWTYVQLASVASSLIFDPLLIRYFQSRGGNGGVGLALASAIAEGVMTVGGVWLAPVRIFDRGLVKTLALAALSGAAMAGASLALRPLLPALVVAPIAVVVYGAALLVTGAISKEQRESILAFVRRKLNRNRPVAN